MTAKLAADLAAREIARETERHEHTVENAKRDLEILSKRAQDEDTLRDIIILSARLAASDACLAALKPLAENPPVPKS